MKSTLLVAGGLLALLSNLSPVQSAPARSRNATPQRPATSARAVSLRHIKTLYITRLNGDPVFTSRLKREIQGMGLRFVSSRKAADALLEGAGSYDNDQFWGRLTLRSHGGQVLWTAQAYRPRGSDYMAYSRLADKLRAALRG